MKTLLTILFFCSASMLVIGIASANPLPGIWCDWENGETAFALVGTGDPAIIATNVADPDPVYEGLHSLRLENNSPSGSWAVLTLSSIT